VEQFVSPKLVARAIGVSESSIKRWCDQGLLATVRTAGGHRRLPTHAVVEFVRQTGQRFVEPQLVGLPQLSGLDELSLEVAVSQLCDALCAGDEVVARRLMFDLYLARHRLVDVFDSVLTPVMHRIGSRWEHSHLEVYQERRACEIVSRVLFELRMALPPAAEEAPYAFGGTLSADPYQLATALVEVSLREAGWRAESFGSNLPMSTLIVALEHKRPRLCWLSVSYVSDQEAFLREYAGFAEVASRQETAIVVGGRALTEPLRRQMRYTSYCDTFRHVAELAGAIYKPAPKTFPTPTSPTAESVGTMPETP
jgi:MerR family transcriptional regulator, light-induced transcriptional regulator